MKRLFLCVVASILPMHSLACRASSVSTTVTLLNGNPISGAYTSDQVNSHHDSQLHYMPYVRDGQETLECVDSRFDQPIVGTPGGDLAEFMGGLSAYYNSSGVNATYESIQTIFRSFMNSAITSSRPFYFHTDDTRLGMALSAISSQVGRNVTHIPLNGPPQNERSIWLQELSASYAQGCGHIRLMISNYTRYGLSSNFIPITTIQVYWEEYWSANLTGKDKFRLESHSGSLSGKAVAIVTSSCAGYSPAIFPNYLSSTLFVYHPTAAQKFREDVLGPFFASLQSTNSLNKTILNSEMNRLHELQLFATLTYLSPANQIHLYTATVANTGSPADLNSTTAAAKGASYMNGISGLLLSASLALFSIYMK